jgi:hypothetical protein
LVSPEVTKPKGETFMNDKRTPNLGALDEQGASRLVSDLLTNPDVEKAHKLRHEAFLMEMTQSGSASGVGRG